MALARSYAEYYGGSPQTVVPLASPAALSLWKNSDLLEAISVNLPATWTVLLWTVKDGRELDKSSDAESLIQIKLTNGGDAGDGLIVLNRAVAGDKTLGSLAVNAERTDVTISLAAAAIAGVDWVKRTASHDFAVHTTGGGKPLLVPPGVVSFRHNVTRSLPS